MHEIGGCEEDKMVDSHLVVGNAIYKLSSSFSAAKNAKRVLRMNHILYLCYAA